MTGEAVEEARQTERQESKEGIRVKKNGRHSYPRSSSYSSSSSSSSSPFSPFSLYSFVEGKGRSGRKEMIAKTRLAWNEREDETETLSSEIRRIRIADFRIYFISIRRDTKEIEEDCVDFRPYITRSNWKEREKEKVLWISMVRRIQHRIIHIFSDVYHPQRKTEVTRICSTINVFLWKGKVSL